MTTRSLRPAATRRIPNLDKRGFTIVEVLTVVGIIAVLMGLILAGLQAAGRTSRQTRELNTLRQLHLAWSSYAASNNDYVLPGYLDEAAQAQWKVRYRYVVEGRVDPSICRTYPWRLLPYLDWGYESMLGYRDAEVIDTIPSKGKTGVVAPEALQLADQPWFGYNAFYIGGWWEQNDATGSVQCRFSNSEWQQTSGGTNTIPTKGKLVLRSIGRATQASSLILFGSSTFRGAGIYTEQDDNLAGAAWITPPILADQNIWGSITGSERIEVFSAQAIPYRRQRAITIVHVDGSSRSESIGNLIDQQRWINAAHDGAGDPTRFTHTPE